MKDINIIRKIWNDPVWSKVIAGIILLSPTLISTIIAKLNGLSFREFFFQTIIISIYQIILVTTSLLLIVIILRWWYIKKKRKVVSISNLFEKEYEVFKSDKTFKHFDEVVKRANSRLNFDNVDKDIVNYYVAKGILFDPQPGYGCYILTGKGEDFFKRRSIEKVNKRSKNDR